MVSVGMFPVSVCLAAGILFSYLSGTFAVLLIALGAILGYVYQIVVIHRLYNQMPYWVVVIGTVAFYIAVYIMLRLIMGNAIEDLFGGVL
jgi:hypothetical protein